jgi:hypothetical protein
MQEITFISRHILQQHCHTYPIALPVRRNPQHRSVLTVVSATFALGRASSATLRDFLDTIVNHFTQHILPIVNRKHFPMNILTILSFCPQKDAQQNAAYDLYSNLRRNIVYQEDFGGLISVRGKFRNNILKLGHDGLFS